MGGAQHLFKFLLIVAICGLVLLSLHRTIFIKLSNTPTEAVTSSRIQNPPFRIAVNTKRIIFWNTVFGDRTWGLPKGVVDKEFSCPNDKKCIQSINRTNPLDGDALIFHMRDGYAIPKKRDTNQVYVMYGWESPVNIGTTFFKGGNFYNWTYTYSKMSELSFLHGSWFKLPKRSPDALKNLPQFKKRKMNGSATVAWIVSSCHASNHRRDYVNALKQYIAIDIYGRCGKPCPKGTGGNSVSCFKTIAETGQYKFYLAFENSACQDYISLKPYRTLESSMLPVVLGGLHSDDYLGLFPPNAYLDVRNFSTPKHLGEYLKFLDNNDDKYLAYHAWRTDYSVQQGERVHHWCSLCTALHNSSMMSTPRNVDWALFWNGATKCDANLVKRLLARKVINKS